jgi:dTDP-4-amino-4,6-dideoxygalactose transaminase
VDAFEHELCLATGAGHAAALSSGTAAIHLALILSGTGPGDYVLCQSFTFSATANPIAYQGATPVFIDSEPATWNMDPELLQKALKELDSKGKLHRVRAIIPVHLYGMPAQMDEILSIAQNYNIPVIEDAAEALGSVCNGRKAGSMGQYAILSFNGNKIITTSGGGALLSKNAELIAKARFLSTQARDKAAHYEHSHIGYNYRMSNVVAGIGRGQLQVLENRVSRRRQINAWYRELLGKLPGINFHTEPSAGYFSNYWLTAITLDEKITGISREQLRLALESENIESRPLWKPMHLQPVFKDVPAYTSGLSEKLFRDGLCLPSGSNMSDSDMERIKNTLTRLFHL